MRTLEPPNRMRIGLMGIVVALLVVAVGQSFTSVPMLFAKPSYYGQFTDSGGLHKGDRVRIAGLGVGTVEGLKIDGDHIVVKFSIGTNTIGTESRLAIRTDTILGRKVLEIEPRGAQALPPGGVLPVGQSTTPYQIYDAFFDVTKAASGWDIETVKRSLNVLSETVDQTYPHLSAALDGVAKFSDTIGKRDEQITHLLAQANQVASILGDRSDQVDRLLVNAKTLIAAFNERGRAVDALLGNISAFSAQVQNLINDNPNLNHVLEQLRILTDLLVDRKEDLAETLTILGRFSASFGETFASGPYFKVLLANLVPGQILQPFVDAAFKKRGISPEDFWRSAGLPAYRWPDPNGTRFPNGAPRLPPPPPRRCWRARPSIPGRRCRRDRRAPTPRRRTVCRGRGIRCPALTSLKVHSVAPISRRRWMSRRRRRTQTVHRPPRAYQSRDVRVRCRRTFPARRCRFHRRLPPGHARCPSGRRLVRLRPRRRQARRHHRAPGRSCRPRSSTPAAPAVVA